jgi:hypothetical protein
VRFYLGTHMPNWLWKPEFADVPLFVSHRRLRKRKSPYPPALTRYAIDSGAYTELDLYGRWVETPEQYVAALRRYAAELGPFDFAAGQDYLCSPGILHRAGEVAGRPVSAAEHQQATVDNYLHLVELAPDLPIVPTLQGSTHDDYLAHAELFTAAGVHLAGLPVVGVGSLVGRTPAFVERLVTALEQRGLHRLHAFGVKRQGIALSGPMLGSADSLAWSAAGLKRPLAGCAHSACNNCPRFALQWRQGVLEAVATAAGAPRQLGFAV